MFAVSQKRLNNQKVIVYSSDKNINNTQKPLLGFVQAKKELATVQAIPVTVQARKKIT